MNLQEIRNEIDSIDDQIIDLFLRRMECSRKVARYKIENGIPVFNAEREKKILDSIGEKAGIYGNSAKLLYSTIMELSRALQYDMMGSGGELHNIIYSACDHVPFNSDKLKISCFGVPGTYAHKACKTVFPCSEPEFAASFREVFLDIQSEKAQFGVIPIENSSAGSVTDVYDLMLKYRYYIAAAVDIPVNHCLAGKKGSDISDIRSVYSHQQALVQCSDFILNRSDITPHTYISTAAAAKMISESSDNTIAAICSEDAAEKYGLDILLRGFQNNPHNTTRFMVISKELYIEDCADKISLCFSLPHQTGSLYSTLCRFAAKGLNLTKIESRPIPDSSFEYLFYLDFTGSILNRETVDLICALSDELEQFSFLGNYREV